MIIGRKTFIHFEKSTNIPSLSGFISNSSAPRQVVNLMMDYLPAVETSLLHNQSNKKLSQI